MDSYITNQKVTVAIDILIALDSKKISLAEAASGLNIPIEDMNELYRNWKC